MNNLPSTRIVRILVTLCFVFALGVSQLSAALTRLPYVQNLTSNSVVVMWRTETPQETRVNYREAGAPSWSEHYSTVPVITHEIKIPNLKPDTRYEYRAVVAGGPQAQPAPAIFQTFPADRTSRFQFAAYGDHRNNPRAHRSVVDAMLKTAEARGLPRFVLDSGDLTGQGEHKTDFYDEQFFTPAQHLLKQVCVFPVIGNHEAHSTHPRIPFRYLEYFSLPTESSGTEYYYSFAFGDAHFTMIDCYATEFQKGSKQYAWIEQDLKRSDKRWKFAMIHYPIYAHRAAPNVYYGDAALREHLVPLFLKYGVTAVFAGHNHFYQRAEVDGIHYIATGGGGAPLYTPGEGMPYVRASKSVFHYTWITIDGDTMTLEAFDPDNERFDVLVTGPREPVLPPLPPINFERRMPSPGMKPGVTIIVESRNADGKRAPDSLYRESGAWTDSTAKSSASGLQGKGTRFAESSSANATAAIIPPLETAGLYLVSVTVPNVASANAPNALFTVSRAAPASRRTGPRSEDPPGLIRGRVSLTASDAGDKWLDIGLIEMKPGDVLTLFQAEDDPDRFYFDAVRFRRYE